MKLAVGISCHNLDASSVGEAIAKAYFVADEVSNSASQAIECQ